MENFANFAVGALDGGVAAGDATLNVASGVGAKLPDVPFRATIWCATDFSDAANDPDGEIILVTGKSGDVLTIVKGQEGTPDADHNTSGKVYGIVNTPTALQLAALTRPIGVRVEIPFDSANFTLSNFEGGGTWTVTDTALFIWYAILGNAAIVNVWLNGDSNIISNTVSPEDELRITLPDELMPPTGANLFQNGVGRMVYRHSGIDSGVEHIGGMFVQDLSGTGDGPVVLTLTRQADGAGVWPDGSVKIYGQLLIAIR